MSEVNPYQLPAGCVLAGRYVIGEVLGEGGFGITYKAADSQNGGMPVAIKEFYPRGYAARNALLSTHITVGASADGRSFEHWREKFLNEAKLLQSCQGIRDVVRVGECLEANSTAYIVMEYLSGCTLKEYVTKNGPFTAIQLLPMMAELLHSLHAVHQAGLIHRDISPDNIMLMDDGRLKLFDFGASRTFHFQDIKTLTIVLKHGYAPAEQYSDHGRQGAWTDIYALCATIYYCLTGVRPPDATGRVLGDATLQSFEELGVQVHPRYAAAIMKGLAPKPEDRFSSALALADELQASVSTTLRPGPLTLKQRVAQQGCLTLDGVRREVLPLMKRMQQRHDEGRIWGGVDAQSIYYEQDGVLALDASAVVDTSASASLTADTVVLKESYAAIEQYSRSHGSLGPWTDVYAICAVMYFALTGMPPASCTQRVLDGALKTPSAYGVAVDAALEAAILKGLSIQPSDRFQTLRELAAAMNAKPAAPKKPAPSLPKLSLPKISLPKITLPKFSLPRLSRKVWFIAGGAAAAIVLAVALIVLLPKGGDVPVVAQPTPVAETATAAPIVIAAPTAAPTAAPIVTATPTASPTATPIVTATPTAAPTATPVVTASPTAAPTATPIVTPIPTPEVPAYVAPPATATPVPTAVPAVASMDDLQVWQDAYELRRMHIKWDGSADAWYDVTIQQGNIMWVDTLNATSYPFDEAVPNTEYHITVADHVTGESIQRTYRTQRMPMYTDYGARIGAGQLAWLPKDSDYATAYAPLTAQEMTGWLQMNDLFYMVDFTYANKTQSHVVQETVVLRAPDGTVYCLTHDAVQLPAAEANKTWTWYSEVPLKEMERLLSGSYIVEVYLGNKQLASGTFVVR